ncbi:MAG: acylphosphatase [Eubacteriaceae bacterium]
MERYYIVFSGRVQGVGFRWFCQTEAANLGLTGWVRNLDNGDVDCEVQGSPVRLKLFLQRIKDGNRWVRVDRCRVKVIPTQNDTKFIPRN